MLGDWFLWPKAVSEAKKLYALFFQLWDTYVGDEPNELRCFTLVLDDMDTLLPVDTLFPVVFLTGLKKCFGWHTEQLDMKELELNLESKNSARSAAAIKVLARYTEQGMDTRLKELSAHLEILPLSHLEAAQSEFEFAKCVANFVKGYLRPYVNEAPKDAVVSDPQSKQELITRPKGLCLVCKKACAAWASCCTNCTKSKGPTRLKLDQRKSKRLANKRLLNLF